MAVFKIKFGTTGKPSKDDGPEKKIADMKPGEETDESEDTEPSYTKAELGKGLISAVKSGDGEAVYEAWKKMADSKPSDDE